MQIIEYFALFSQSADTAAVGRTAQRALRAGHEGRKPGAGAPSFHHYLYKMLALNHFNG